MYFFRYLSLSIPKKCTERLSITLILKLNVLMDHLVHFTFMKDLRRINSSSISLAVDFAASTLWRARFKTVTKEVKLSSEVQLYGPM